MIADTQINKITAHDLELLVSNGVAESRALEYKEAIPGGADQDKREFLADVSSFANAIGGDLIYGVRERRDHEGKPTGTPEAIVGIEVENLDQLIQRIENVLRDGLAPRVPGIRFQAVAGFERGPALVVRIPQSWAAPHMVSFQRSGKFFTRHAGGKHQLDVLEVRDAFLNTRSASERAEEFRTARLGRLIGGGAVVPLSSEKFLCVHAVPHGALFGALTIDLSKAAAAKADMRPVEAITWGDRFNIDGVISVASTGRGNKSTGYVQLFRNGTVEVVWSEVFFDPGSKMVSPGVGASDVARELFGLVERLQRLFVMLEVPPAVSFFVSLHGMRGVTLHTSHRLSLHRHFEFDRDTILLPEVAMENVGAPPAQVLRPAMDALWQAAGLERCFYYSDDGRWMPQS